jgi:hypothetical protein
VSETNAKTALFYALLGWLCLQWLVPAQMHEVLQAVILFVLFAGFSLFCASSIRKENFMRYHAPMLAWISTLPFFTAEFQYLLYQKSRIFISPYSIWLAFAIIIFIIAYRRKIPLQIKDSGISAWLILSIGFGIMSFYRPMSEMPEELFELANRALPLMELHYFRTIPLLEKASSHFVSDYGFGLIYQLIHGYKGLDFLIYDVFDQLI